EWWNGAGSGGMDSGEMAGKSGEQSDGELILRIKIVLMSIEDWMIDGIEADNHNQNENRFPMCHPSKSRMWGVEDGRSREGCLFCAGMSRGSWVRGYKNGRMEQEVEEWTMERWRENLVNRVMLKVSPWKGVVRSGKRGKLKPRYIGPLKVLSKVRDVACRLKLPQQLNRVHNTFHVTNLKKCLSDESLMIPLDELRIDDKLYFVEEPLEILDHEIKKLKRSRIPIIKVRWNSKRGPEFTWEREDQFKQKHPHLFTNTAPSSSVTS
nr:putative reverse transcriptase domain-containing protein [Tanacetum cinerariifolium]